MIGLLLLARKQPPEKKRSFVRDTSVVPSTSDFQMNRMRRFTVFRPTAFLGLEDGQFPMANFDAPAATFFGKGSNATLNTALHCRDVPTIFEEWMQQTPPERAVALQIRPFLEYGLARR